MRLFARLLNQLFHKRKILKVSQFNLGLVKMAVLRPEQVFAVHPKIRWVGIVAMKGSVLFSGIRPGVKSVTPEAEDRLMLELQAPFHAEMANRRTQWIGPLELAVAKYERFYEVHLPLGENLVVVTVDKDTPFTEIPEIARKIRDLSM